MIKGKPANVHVWICVFWNWHLLLLKLISHLNAISFFRPFLEGARRCGERNLGSQLIFDLSIKTFGNTIQVTSTLQTNQTISLPIPRPFKSTASSLYNFNREDAHMKTRSDEDLISPKGLL